MKIFSSYIKNEKPFAVHKVYLISSVYTDVKQLDFSRVFSSTPKKPEASQEDVRINHESYGFNGMTRVAPTATVRLKS